MPVSLSSVSRLSAFHFQTSWSFYKLWIFQVGPAALIRTGSGIRNPRNSLHDVGMLILFEFFLEVLLLDPHFFFQHIVAQVRPSIWHFENSSPLLWNPRYSESGFLPDPFVRTFSLLCHFHMNLNIQNSWPNWPNWTYHWQFSTGNHFHVKWSTNPRPTSILPTASISLCAFSGRFR